MLVEGDEGDFLYWLLFHRGSQEAKINASVTGGPNTGQTASATLESDTEATQIFLGWHGIDLGGFGIGPAVLHQNLEAEITDATLNGVDYGSLDLGSGKTTFAGLLTRSESDKFDFTTAIGLDAGSDGVKSGNALFIEGDFHVSDALTLSAAWERVQADYEHGLFDFKENRFTLGGRYRIAENFFVEGEAFRAKQEQSLDITETGFRIGVGTVF